MITFNSLPTSLDLSSFVAVDVETTGLSSRTDKIIDLAAVKFENGKVLATWHRLVDPGVAIPAAITRLTGITDDDCHGQPSIDELIDEFLDFVGHLPLVGHNLPFDKGFIEAASGPLDNLTFDTLQLARMLIPSLPSYKLASVAEHLQIPPGQYHRALADATISGGIFLRLLDLMGGTDPGFQRTVAGLLDQTDSAIPLLFNKLTDDSPSAPPRPRETRGHRLPMIMPDNANTDETSDSAKELDMVELSRMFEMDGLLSRRLETYEHRSEQVEMTQAVARAFNQSELAVIEAGTGTGKSLAYLVPAILWSLENHYRVIISTNTKNLQEQLFLKDVPFLKKVIPAPFAVALLKGRGNYVCLNKWQTVLAESDLKLNLKERQQILPLVFWLQQTATGDIAENNAFNPAHHGELWSKVCAEASFCMGQKCRHFSRCYLMQARKKALESNIVIVNHSLLFADLVSDASILGNYEYLVIDEAHHLEKVALRYFGRECNRWVARSTAHALYEKDLTDVGILVSLKQRFLNSDLGAKLKKTCQRKVEKVIDQVRSFTTGMNSFFAELTDVSRARIPAADERNSSGENKFRYRPGDNYLASIADIAATYHEELVTLKSGLLQLAEWLQELEADTIQGQDEFIEQLAGKAQDLQGQIDTLQFLVTPEADGHVFWAELPRKADGTDTTLAAAPLAVAQLLKDTLYERMRSIVFTSATLAVGGKFDYFLSRSGLALTSGERVATLVLGSSFDFASQSLVLVPNYLPSPKDDRFQADLEQTLAHVLAGAGKGTLVLFTSYSMLNKSYHFLKKALSTEDILLLGQGLDGSRTMLLDQFRADQRSVLLGTDSFWEGVDVPGAALELLFIVKLPFSVPSEPLVQAQIEELEKQGVNPFMEYTVPEAVIKFRQGFGRLIRSKTDRGVVVVLDKRVITTRYGRLFLESLPCPHQIVNNPEEMVEMIRNW